jgi:hypothetical protein
MSVLPHVQMGTLKIQQFVHSVIQHVFNVLLALKITSAFHATNR